MSSDQCFCKFLLWSYYSVQYIISWSKEPEYFITIFWLVPYIPGLMSRLHVPINGRLRSCFCRCSHQIVHCTGLNLKICISTAWQATCFVDLVIHQCWRSITQRPQYIQSSPFGWYAWKRFIVPIDDVELLYIESARIETQRRRSHSRQCSRVRWIADRDLGRSRNDPPTAMFCYRGIGETVISRAILFPHVNSLQWQGC